jgi:RimJ/RimL family protein N-acetyltransferase
MTPTVRAATPADARAVAEIRFASWRATYSRLLPSDVWDGIDLDVWAARTAQRFADRTTLALVAESNGAVRAFAFYGPCRDDDLPGAGEIYAIYAHPDHWSTGLGRALLPAAVDAVGRAPVVLWVLEDNPRARRFYELAGFVADGARKQADMLGGVQLPEIRYRRA